MSKSKIDVPLVAVSGLVLATLLAALIKRRPSRLPNGQPIPPKAK